MADRYIPLGPGENARYLRNRLILSTPPTANQLLQFNGEAWASVSIGAVSGIGDVTGPASGTDNAVPRFNLTTGKLLQDSNVLVDDAGNMSGVVDLSINSLQTSAGVTINAAGYLTGLTSLTTTTLIVTDVITTGDNMIVLNDEVTGAPSEDAGIEVNRGTSTDSRLMWNETNDRWEAGLSGNLSNIVRNSDLSGITHNTFSGRDTTDSHPASAISINNTPLGVNATEVQTLLENIYTAGVRADSLQGTSINSITLNSAFDGYVLTYNSVDSEWVAEAASGGGGTDLTGTQVDNVITRGNGTDTVQSSGWTIDDSKNMSVSIGQVTVTLGADDDNVANSTDGVDIILKAGNKTAGTGNGGDIILQAGNTTGGSSGEIYFKKGTAELGRFEGGGGLYVGSGLIKYNGGNSSLDIGGSGASGLGIGSTQVLMYVDMGPLTDGAVNFGKRGGLLRRPANIYAKTSINSGTNTNEVGLYDAGNGAGAATSGYRVAGTQVVGQQVAAIGLDAKTDSEKITDIITALRAHGLLGPNA